MASRNQPTFNLFSGAPESPQQVREPLRQTFKTTFRASQNAPHTVVSSDPVNEDLRAQINTLRYELETAKQEQEKAKLEHDAELRDLQNRAETEHKKAQQAESANNLTANKYESLRKEMSETHTTSENERQDLQRRLRTSQDKAQQLQEDVDELKEELASTQRQNEHRYNTLQTEHKSLKESVDDIKLEADSKINAMRTAQRKLAEKEAEVGELEAEVLRLKAITGDVETIAVIKKELSEQVTHIKKLEKLTYEQNTELKQHRKKQKAIEVVEEEKRTLQIRVRMVDDLQKQLNEAERRKQNLEDERNSWTSYLETEADADAQFESPEDLARAFIQVRFEKTDLMDRLGAIQPELTVKESNIQALEDEKAKLQSEIQQMKTSNSNAPNSNETKARARLERQKALVTKEVDFLRAQIKAFDDEERELHPETYDAAKTDRVKEMEDLVDQYRKEVETLQKECNSIDRPVSIAAGQKRPLDTEEVDERVGELRRIKLIESEYKAQHSQLKKLKESSRTRVLEFKANPTADAEALKLKTVRTLREANTQLLTQLQGATPSNVVSAAAFESIQDELSEAHNDIASLEKKTKRLKQIWAAKSLEFREAVASVLGWKLDFMPNGRVKVTSMFKPADEDSENSIVFDGENGTMKVSGGEQSVFAGEIRDQIVYWVEGRKEIPCFLAALTLEFWERRNGDTTRQL
jgi:mitotic spindle assembly checkpoint protein MAD1